MCLANRAAVSSEECARCFVEVLVSDVRTPLYSLERDAQAQLYPATAGDPVGRHKLLVWNRAETANVGRVDELSASRAGALPIDEARS